MNNSNNKLINFSDVHLKMVEDLKAQTGKKTLTSIIQEGLARYHKSYFPAYAPNASSGPETEESLVNKAVAKAKAKKALADAQENIKLAPKVNICENILKGEVEIDEKGFKYCKFTTYSTDELKDADQKMPLRQVDYFLEDNNLFVPNKEAVFKARPDIKKLFNK